MKSPRRIFRSSYTVRPRRVGRAALAWLTGTVALTGLVMVGLSSDLFGRAPAGPERLQVESNQVAVVGGDTLRLAGQVIRLAGIEAPARGNPCSGGADCGGTAALVLAGLVRDQRIECRLSGQDSMGRPFGACEANGVDLSRAVVARGWARAQRDTPALVAVEQQARHQGAGLWATAHP